jgi:hypothetical protein
MMTNKQIEFQGRFKTKIRLRMALVVVVCALQPASRAFSDSTSEPVVKLLNLMLDKGIISEDDAAKFQAQLGAEETNQAARFPISPWKINAGIKDFEIFGDVRTRFEDRSEQDPVGDKVELQRYRYSVRLGFRGEALDDFYYGLRLETSSNPRSSFVTMGTSSSGAPYEGPYGKSTAGITIGQAYLGWHPESWLDITAGKMPNPLYTTTLVWSRNINPEGLAEHVRYATGPVEFFGNFAQFLYQDANPVSASPDLGLGVNGAGQNADNIFQVAWQGGLTYRFSTNTSLKVAATLYEYYGQKQGSENTSGISPYFGDNYVGEGAYAGPGSLSPVNGYSGYGSSGGLTGYESFGYPNNQVGLNNLEVVEIPFELNFKIKTLDAQLFGDVAYNLQGSQRAQAAAAGYAAYLANLNQGNSSGSTIKGFSPQVHDDKAYQIGFALASKGDLGLVEGTTSSKHAWEVKTYWQHVEQYSLDPNLLDQDIFAGDENLEGIYFAVAYGFSQNFIGNFRYGHATRINSQLGTGGTGQDIPQINPINELNLFQADLTFKF